MGSNPTAVKVWVTCHPADAQAAEGNGDTAWWWQKLAMTSNSGFVTSCRGKVIVSRSLFLDTPLPHHLTERARGP